MTAGGCALTLSLRVKEGRQEGKKESLKRTYKRDFTPTANIHSRVYHQTLRLCPGATEAAAEPSTDKAAASNTADVITFPEEDSL